LTLLDEIVLSTRKRVERSKREVPIDNLPARSTELRSLAKAIEESEKVPVVAEIKPKSPSAGVLRGDLNVAGLAKECESGGAIGMSVLTEPDYFGGGLKNLIEVKNSVGLPVLRKDFIVDEYQVHESVAHGADSILLIVSCLGDRLKGFLALADRVGLEALVECHSKEEVENALEAGARIIGVNNRDLKTMEVNLSRTEELAPNLKGEVITVSESGIRGPDDVRRALEAGADAVLVGTALMRSNNVKQKVQSLVNAR